MSLPPFPVRLIAARPLTPTVRELVFERVDGAPVVYEAGQWISLDIPQPSGTVVRRAYSIASAPGCAIPGDDARVPHRFELAVTHVEGGPGSTALHAMAVGTVLDAIGPQGFFIRREQHPSLFVATGSGLTPLRSMVRDALARGERSPMHVLCGVRTPEERLYAEEFEALAATLPHFRATYTLSRGADDWAGPRGYVQTHVRALYEELAADPAREAPHVYICGLQKMVSAVRDVLRKEMDLPRQVVHSERYD
jgi:ferredoxin-NADP reductase